MITPCELKYDELKDYKFFCFNGKVCFFKVDFGRFVEHQANYCDTDGNLLPFWEKDLEPNPNYPIEMPENLSKHETFPRVDFYNVNGKIYFGELTFYPASGIGKFTPIGTDSVLGELIDFDTI